MRGKLYALMGSSVCLELAGKRIYLSWEEQSDTVSNLPIKKKVTFITHLVTHLSRQLLTWLQGGFYSLRNGGVRTILSYSPPTPDSEAGLRYADLIRVFSVDFFING